MVILKEAKRQQEKAEEEAERRSAQQGMQNSAAGMSGSNTHTISGETIEYVNENA